MTRRRVLLAVAAIAGALGWYWFRPERAVIDRRVSERPPAAAASVLRGSFHSNAHATRGIATVYRAAAGELIVRFTEFETSDGPDVRIYLVASEDVAGDADIRRGFVDLGALKGNVGDQNYSVPAGTDLTTYRAVSVWCRRFKVNFGAAPLQNVPSPSGPP
jgi:hypothetical protein